MKNEELKPLNCSFCGGTVLSGYNNQEYEMLFIHCDRCGGNIGIEIGECPDFEDDGEDEFLLSETKGIEPLIMKWNTRWIM